MGWFYRVGAELACVRTLGSTHRLDAKDLRSFQGWLGNVDVSSITPPSPIIKISDDEQLIVSLALGLLQRGSPTLASPVVEEALLRSLEPVSGLIGTYSVSNDDGIKARLDATEPGVWAALLSAAVVIGHPAASPDPALRFESPAERAFYDDHAGYLLGGALGLLEPQRPLTSMLSPEMAERDGTLVDQRVDFAIASPTNVKGGEGEGQPTRLVVEIDGSQYHRGPQARQDHRRDRKLERAGWSTVRIPTDAANAGADLLKEIEAVVEGDSFLRRSRDSGTRHLLSSVVGREAARLLWTPHAVARFQLAVLLALTNGRLRFGHQVWRIAVVERDVPFAELATLDLLTTISQLCALYDVDPPRRVELTVVRRHVADFARPDTICVDERTHEKVATTYADGPSDVSSVAVDVYVDVAVTACSTEIFGRDQVDPTLRVLSASATATAIVRTAPSERPLRPVEWPAPRAVNDPAAKRETLEYFLRLVFRKQTFRDGQLPIIERVLRQESVVGLLATGSGKSLTFQLPALLRPGAPLVVAPIKALINDQLDNLAGIGIDQVIGIHSDLKREAKTVAERSIADTTRRFLYVAPERLQIRTFCERLREINSRRPVSLVAVDEAHCVSEWGHDFRPAYLRLGETARELCMFGKTVPPLMALTGTASQQVLEDMQRELGIEGDEDEAVVSPESFDRRNLHFEIRRAGPGEKRAKLEEWIGALPGALGIPCDVLYGRDHAGIVFCRTVGRPGGVVAVTQVLRQHPSLAGKTVEYYAGGKPKSFDERRDGAWADHKDRVQRDFKHNKFPLLVATHSFGMGIDKPNIRFTVHYAAPPSLEAFAQEAGRAGRDGKVKAVCAVIFTDDVLSNDQQDFLQANLSAEEALDRYEALPKSQQGDAAGAMYFHKGSYPSAREDAGRIRELYLTYVAPELVDADEAEVVIPYEGNDEARKEIERSVYRLSILGVVDQYTVDYLRDEIVATVHWLDDEEVLKRLTAYVRRYRGESRMAAVQLRFWEPVWTDLRDGPAERAAEVLCWFVYEQIEKQRREKIDNMRRVFRRSENGAALKAELAVYLDNSVFSSRVKRMSSSVPSEWWSIVDEVETVELAMRLSGACARSLESQPDHPGLLIVRALCDAKGQDADLATVALDLSSAVEIFDNNHQDAETIRAIADRIVVSLRNVPPDAVDRVVGALVLDLHSELFARAGYPFVGDPALRRASALPYIGSIVEQANAFAASHLRGHHESN